MCGPREGDRENLRLMHDKYISRGESIVHIYRIHFRVFLSESSLKLGQSDRERANVQRQTGNGHWALGNGQRFQ